MPITEIDIHSDGARLAKKIGVTRHAQSSMVFLRARFIAMPCLLRRPGNHPPATLPTVDIT
jgi:hypothetical protein